MHIRREFLGLWFDCLAVEDVLAYLRDRKAQPLSYVVTPNVDHIVRLNSPHCDFWMGRSYFTAGLCLCDSRILAAIARLFGIKLPVVPGSDLTAQVIGQLLDQGARVAIVGGDDRLIDDLGREYPHLTFPHHAPPMDLAHNPGARTEAANFIAHETAAITFLAVGSPQQELIALEASTISTRPGVVLCVGASLDFLTGRRKRAPHLMQRLGLEWLFRLLSEPGRLWRRYLVSGPKIFWIALHWARRRREGTRPHSERRLPGTRGDSSNRGLVSASLLICTAAGFLALASTNQPFSVSGLTGGSTSFSPRSELTAISSLPAPDRLRPLAPTDAQRENAERPFISAALLPARPFNLAGDNDSRTRALKCLTQAIYYEAASEGIDGGRAVAQVVLNRVRRPGFPNSICGVVYQGWERATGCQFSFTCDGSLSKQPNYYYWKLSERIALMALNGYVFNSVGLSTHYHANYVSPYWSDYLEKSTLVGRHIFYMLPKDNSTHANFSQRYSAREPAPPLLENALMISDSIESSENLLLSDDSIGFDSVPESSAAYFNKSPPLSADEGAGTLIRDSFPTIRIEDEEKSGTLKERTFDFRK